MKQLGEILTGSPLSGGAKYMWGIQIRDFRQISRYILQTIQDRAIVTMAIENRTWSVKRRHFQ